MFLWSDCAELAGGLEDMSRMTRVVYLEGLFCDNAGDLFLALYGASHPDRRMGEYWGDGETRVAKEAGRTQKGGI